MHQISRSDHLYPCSCALCFLSLKTLLFKVYPRLPRSISLTVRDRYAVLIAPGLIKIQFIKGYAVLIAPGLIKIQFIMGYAVLIAPGLIRKYSL